MDMAKVEDSLWVAKVCTSMLCAKIGYRHRQLCGPLSVVNVFAQICKFERPVSTDHYFSLPLILSVTQIKWACSCLLRENMNRGKLWAIPTAWICLTRKHCVKSWNVQMQPTHAHSIPPWNCALFVYVDQKLIFCCDGCVPHKSHLSLWEYFLKSKFKSLGARPDSSYCRRSCQQRSRMWQKYTTKCLPKIVTAPNTPRDSVVPSLCRLRKWLTLQSARSWPGTSITAQEFWIWHWKWKCIVQSCPAFQHAADACWSPLRHRGGANTLHRCTATKHVLGRSQQQIQQFSPKFKIQDLALSELGKLSSVSKFSTPLSGAVQCPHLRLECRFVLLRTLTWGSTSNMHSLRHISVTSASLMSLVSRLPKHLGNRRTCRLHACSWMYLYEMTRNDLKFIKTWHCTTEYTKDWFRLYRHVVSDMICIYAICVCMYDHVCIVCHGVPKLMSPWTHALGLAHCALGFHTSSRLEHLCKERFYEICRDFVECQCSKWPTFPVKSHSCTDFSEGLRGHSAIQLHSDTSWLCWSGIWRQM